MKVNMPLNKETKSILYKDFSLSIFPPSLVIIIDNAFVLIEILLCVCIFIYMICFFCIDYEKFKFVIDVQTV